METDQPIILFDGVCNLCNASVHFILQYEKKERFKFTSLQSEKAQLLLTSFNTEEITDSVILIEKNKMYQQSTAALKIARHLRYFWVLYYLIYVPHYLRDPIYQIIAKNRYSWFGKRDKCMVPDGNIKDRFL
jgi:predicted DCC family thiol-disulfide oxidoreductase YuxK